METVQTVRYYNRRYYNVTESAVGPHHELGTKLKAFPSSSYPIVAENEMRQK